MADETSVEDSTSSDSTSSDGVTSASAKPAMLRRIVRGLVRVYYPRIDVAGAEHIPSDGPVLLCANHANSLIDPVLIGWTSKRPVRFLAKAPLFKTPVLGPLMNALGMIPAFRGSDDSRQVRRNMQSLDAGSQALLQGDAMGIFPEGKSHDAMALEMVRSGASRIAIQAAEQGADGLVVVPIGLNYQHKEQFRSSVWIVVGEPIPISEWLDRHGGESRPAMRALTSELDSRLREVVIHLDELEWEPWVGELESLLQHNAVVAARQQTPLQRRKRIADAINHFLARDRHVVEGMAERITAFRRAVGVAGLRVNSPVLSTSGFQLFCRLAKDAFWLIVLCLPALAGSLYHCLPFVLTRAVSRKIRTPGRTTVSMYRLAVGLPVYVAWYAASTWVLLEYLPAALVWSWECLMPFCGLLALEYWRRARGMGRAIWFQVVLWFRRRELKVLRGMHAEISDQLVALGARYDADLAAESGSRESG